jgi:tRNA pseudouridine32 synthase / 23S rRNA pseudouridine746 synthase
MSRGLPRTPVVVAAAQALMRELQLHDLQVGTAATYRYDRESKMYGVLLAETPAGEQVLLKAFSGWLWGQSDWPGWVPSIPGRQRVALFEAQTLAQLEQIKQSLLALHNLPLRQELAALEQTYRVAHQTEQDRLVLAKQQRQLQRQQQPDPAQLARLDQQSQTDSREFRLFKKTWRVKLQPLQAQVMAADQQILALKQQRRSLSKQLQLQLHQAYTLQNFAGQSRNLADLAPQGLPTGTGDCCAPKLLQAAAQQGLRPVALAEFWWGERQGDRVAGQFYEPCAERCQPIMGFLLSGLSLGEAFAQAVTAVNPAMSTLSEGSDIRMVYEDDWLVVVDKPTGLLSVPGRYHDRQDSVWSRLVQVHPQIRPVHRLDQDTSGLLVLAKKLELYRQLAQQWQQRQVEKIYEAIVVGEVTGAQGEIDLPLKANPEHRLQQLVDWAAGKPSFTTFRVLHSESSVQGRSGNSTPTTRLELRPHTGRTHQLRVHTAIGLKTPILGDQLYGCPLAAERLHLHARSLKFWHPVLDQMIGFEAATPF